MNIRLPLLLFSFLLSPILAHALPLLSENSAQRVTSLLTLFPDHQNSNLFYFFPDSSDFTHTSAGLPHFGLTHWGRSTSSAEDDGGFVTFQMHLKSSREQAAALQDFLDRHPGAGIAVLPVIASTVGLTSSSSPGGHPLPGLFTDVNFPPRAGLAEHPVGINASLTGAGVRVFLGGIRNPMSFKIDYCFKVQGLGPNFDATITADFNRVYEHFRAAAAIGGWWSNIQVAHETTRLVQNGSIRYVINGGNATDEEYVRSIVNTISQRFFTPQVPATPAVLPHIEGWSFSNVQLGNTRIEELRTETWTMNRREMVEREYCVPMSLTELRPFSSQVVYDSDRDF